MMEVMNYLMILLQVLYKNLKFLLTILYNDIGGNANMETNQYKNIKLTRENRRSNCVTHSGKFHVDDVISTMFLSKLKKNVILLRISTIDNNLNLENKLIYDIGLRRI